MVDRKLYLIGSVGQHGAGEGYAGAYQLTNLKAYNETCAAIALAMWNHRMFLLHGDAKYVDVLERILYNGFLSGVSLSGDRFFYPNPLECDMHFKFNQGSLERSPWFGCSCCPSNVVRFLPSIPGYVYAAADQDIYVNLFLAGKASIPLGEDTMSITQTTEYPWNGKVRMAVSPASARQFALRIRIPAWVRGQVLPSDLYRYVDNSPAAWSLKVNGQAVDAQLVGGYAVLNRQWQPGDVVELDMDMPIRRVLANEQIEFDRGRVAFERGPLVYCIEGADHDGAVRNLWIKDQAQLAPEFEPDLLGGVMVLRGTAQAVQRDEHGALASAQRPLTMIPYYAWCHRGANELVVWLPRSADNAVVPPRPTIASQARASASHTWSADSTAALQDQVQPANSGDHQIPRFTWWDHRGTTEWVQYDFDRPQTVSQVAVYWFDDTGRGQCRVPQNCQVLYRQDEAWQSVEAAGALGVKKDCLNTLKFAPVTTTALRLQVQLQPELSGGILEWSVE